MLLDIFTTIIDALGELVSTIGFAWFAVIVLGLAILAIIISFIVTQCAIEIKTARAVNRINKYLEMNPFVNEDNLVEFNKLMKHIPQPMRLQWQQYMVNRDKNPSAFFTDANCIEKPFKSSAYGSQIIAVRASFICLALLAVVFTMSYNVYIAEPSILTGILTSILISAVLAFVCELYLFFLKVRRNSVLSDLYYNFANFQKYIDRACSTLPEYVDYEILFTRKEITNGIPVLQEYLQQRAIFEQEQIKKAKESQVVHETYDFSALGINGSLVMERAMRESEYVIGNQRRVLAEISELEGARDMLDKSYDEKNKNSQRKLRDIQESLDRLKEKLDNTTNLIVGNDLRKQRENEIQKQRQLEKEAEEDNRKYEADRKQLNEQIEAKRAEIDEFRKNAESTLNGEFKTYADKIYAELMTVVQAKVQDQVDSLTAEKVQLEQQLEEKDRLYVEKSTVCDEKSALVEEYSAKIAEQEVMIEEAQKIKEEFEEYSAAKDQEIFETKRDLESRNLELEQKTKQIEEQKQEIKELKSKKQIVVNRYFDVYGNEIFYDDDGMPYVVDEMGKKEYISAPDSNNEVSEEQMMQQEQEFANEEMPEEPEEKEEKVAEPESIIDLNFTDADILEALGEDPNEKKEEPEEQASLEELKQQFKKPAYDFQWENSNAQQEPEAEQVEEPAQSTKDLQSDIDEIDKMIEEQNAELEKQNQELSKQLEETQKVAEEVEEKPKKKAPAKKKPAKKKSQSNGGKKPAQKAKKSQPKKAVEVDVNLESFNEQLNEAIDKIDDNGNKDE